VLDDASVRALFPALQLGDELEGLHDPAAGVLLADRAVAAQQRLARESGARLREAEPLLGWAADGEGVAVETVGGRIAADRLVVCAGAWMPGVLPGLEQRVVRRVNVHLQPVDPALVAVPALGVFAFDLPLGVVSGVGALGPAGVKLGLDDRLDADPDAPRLPAGADEIAALRAVAERHVPAAAGEVLSTVTSMAAKRLVVGALPDTPQVLACSGHEFAFAPAIGEALADLAAGIARPDLDFIAPSRLARVS
jgi:sarcosine oxidase